MRSAANRQGGSTLTQQLARSGLLGIGREQTLTRKFNEILYALLMEARYDKRTILETYFNQVDVSQRGGAGDPRRGRGLRTSGSGATCATSTPSRSRC